MSLMVKCPICDKPKKVKNTQKSFRCCCMNLEVEKFIIAESFRRSIDIQLS